MCDANKSLSCFFYQNRPDPKVAYITALCFFAVIVIIIPAAILIRYRCCDGPTNPYSPTSGDPESPDDAEQDELVIFSREAMSRQTTAPPLMSGQPTQVVTSTPHLSDTSPTQPMSSLLSDTSTILYDTSVTPLPPKCVVNLQSEFNESNPVNAAASLGQGCVWGAVGNNTTGSLSQTYAMELDEVNLESEFDGMARSRSQTPDRE